MFEVKSLGQNNSNIIPILNGITFGFIGLPLFFNVKHEKIETNLIVELLVDNNEKRKQNEFETKGIENNVLRINYYNPSIGTSGLTSPFGLQLFEKEIFSFMFYFDCLNNSKTYRLTYEFYHGQLPQ